MSNDEPDFEPWPTSSGLSLHTLSFRASASGRSMAMTPKELVAGIIAYFEWLENNPLKMDKVSFYQGEAQHEPEDRMRAATIRGLCLYLGISVITWEEWRGSRSESGSRPEFHAIIEHAEAMIHDSKFAGAAGGLLHAGIIMRDLGLADRSELSGPNGQPLEQVVQYQLPSNHRDGGSEEE